MSGWMECGPYRPPGAKLTEPEHRVADAAEWWAWTSRAIVHRWMATLFHLEVSLSATEAGHGVLVLGRNQPFSPDDRRQVDRLRRHLTAVERLIACPEPIEVISSKRRRVQAHP